VATFGEFFLVYNNTRIPDINARRTTRESLTSMHEEQHEKTLTSMHEEQHEKTHHMVYLIV
jgi:fructose-1,6-bisphosphatase